MTINLLRVSVCSVIGLVILVMGRVGVYADESAAAFLDMELHPKTVAMGSVRTVSDSGAYAVNANPARLVSGASGYRVSVMGTRAFETDYTGVFVSGPVADGLVWGGGYLGALVSGVEANDLDLNQRLESTGEILSYRGNGYFLGMGMRVLRDVSVGVSAKYLQERAGGYGADGWGMDVGVSAQLMDVLQLGATVQNVVEPQLKWNTPSGTVETVKRALRLGGRYEVIAHQVWVSGEWVMRANRPSVLVGGVAVQLASMLQLRGGVNQDRYSLGLGLALQPLQLDFSWTPATAVLEDVYRVGVSYGL